MSIDCIIVDDERLAQNVLEKYIESLNSLTLIKKCNSALEAISYMHENKVDLIFLDIDMPEISGLEMLKTIKNKPYVILTTAYSEYALEGYEYGVIDYLLKPIPFERFLTAIDKVTDINSKHSTNYSSKISENIILKQDGVSYNVPLESILYIEAYGNYLNIYCDNHKYIVRAKMHAFENKLSKRMFLRVHKSYIVSLDKFSSIEGNRLKINDDIIPIGNFYKSQLMKWVNR